MFNSLIKLLVIFVQLANGKMEGFFCRIAEGIRELPDYVTDVFNRIHKALSHLHTFGLSLFGPNQIFRCLDQTAPLWSRRWSRSGPN